MPVSAEIIENPAGQDLTDLSRIYETPENQLPAWLREALDGEAIVIAGRFNARLLGAFCLQPQGGNRYRLERLQVREVTRRRGVARQLLLMALRRLPPQVKRIEVDLSDHPHLESLFAEVGFTTGESAGRLHWDAP